LRAVLIGVVLFLLLQATPFLLLKLSGVDLPGPPPVEEAPEPIYHDKSGKRINEPDYRIMVGHDRAQASGIASHAECKNMAKIFEAEGCHRFVTAQKAIPPHIRQENFGSGKTTTQCRDEVNAYWEPLIQDMREEGKDHAAGSWTRRNWMPELAECQNYDNIRIGDVIHKPASRLQDLVKKAEDGGRITEPERAMVLKDLTGVSAFPDNPYKQAYLAQSDYFFQLADGTIKPPEKTPLQLSCPEFQARLDELRQAEQETNAAQARLKRSDGVVTDGAQWKALNQVRLDRLWDWKLYTDGAKAAGCAMADSR